MWSVHCWGMKIIGIVMSGSVEVVDMIMASFGFQMCLLWIRRLRNPVIPLLVIGERRSQLIIQIPHSHLMLGILLLSLQLTWPILRISLWHSSTVFRFTPASHDIACVLSTARMDLRPVVS